MQAFDMFLSYPLKNSRSPVPALEPLVKEREHGRGQFPRQSNLQRRKSSQPQGFAEKHNCAWTDSAIPGQLGDRLGNETLGIIEHDFGDPPLRALKSGQQPAY
jgi:hypothetical protein